ncbi:MAG: hypothetical protein U1E05_20155 [Patescibacteria group bacterium]|nr:hypothetical protein [Patescibacteria group bacterium]
MPSYRVSGSTLSLGMFDVVGKDGDDGGFIGHVGLALAGKSQDASRVFVVDMGPPLRGEREPGRIAASVVGAIALTDDEVRKIRTFIDRHASEHQVFLHVDRRQLLAAAPTMYRIHPHAEPFHENDGRYARTRFSCAGFVFEAYKKARIALVDLNSLPMCDIAIIDSGYRRHMRFMEAEGISRDALGLAGDGPWPILLCGYLLHSLNREANVVRRELYTPSISDRHFT